MSNDKVKKAIRYSIYGISSLLFFFSFGLAGRYPYNYVNIALWVVLAGLYVLNHNWKKRFHPDVFFLINLFYMLVQLVSYAASGFTCLPTTTLVITATNLILYQILIEDDESKDKWFVIAGIGCALFLLAFAIVYRNQIIHPDLQTRIGNFFDNQNNVARSLAMTSILLFANGARSKKVPLKILWFVGALISFYFMVLTGSVSSVLTLSIVAFVAIPLSFKKRRWLVFLIETGLIVTGVMAIFFVPGLSYYANRILGMLGSIGAADYRGDMSFNSRLQGAIVGFEVFLNAPLTGSGYGAVQNAFYITAHNNFSEVLADFGVFGFAALESLLLLPMISLAKHKKEGWLTPFSLLLFVFCFQLFLLMHNSKPDNLIMTLCFASCYEKGLYPAFLRRKWIRTDRLVIK